MLKVEIIIQYGIQKIVMHMGRIERINPRWMIRKSDMTGDFPSKCLSAAHFTVQSPPRGEATCIKMWVQPADEFSGLQLYLTAYNYLSSSFWRGTQSSTWVVVTPLKSILLRIWVVSAGRRHLFSRERVTPHHCPLRKRRPEGFHRVHSMGPGSV